MLLCDLDDPNSLDPLLPDRWLSEHSEAQLPMREKEAQKKALRKHRRRHRGSFENLADLI